MIKQILLDPFPKKKQILVNLKASQIVAARLGVPFNYQNSGHRDDNDTTSTRHDTDNRIS